MVNVLQRLEALEALSREIEDKKKNLCDKAIVHVYSVIDDKVRILYYSPAGCTDIWTDHDGAEMWMKAHSDALITISWGYCLEWIFIYHCYSPDAQSRYTERQREKFKEQYLSDDPTGALHKLLEMPKLMNMLVTLPQWTSHRE